MIYLKVIKNRYVHILCISIFFSSFVLCQSNLANELYDSIGSVEIYPDDATALSIFERIYRLSKEEENRNLELESSLYISYFQDMLGRSLESSETLENAFAFAQDTSGIYAENIILAYQLMQDLERRRGNLIRANDLNKKYVELELLNGANDVQLGLSYLEMAAGLRTLGDLENAILYSTKSFDLFKNAPDSLFEQEFNFDKNYLLSKSLQFRGLSLKDLKQYPDAIADYENNFTFLKKSKNFSEQLGKKALINGYNRLSDAYLLNNDLEKASKSLQSLAKINRNESYEKFRFYELLAVLSLKNGDLLSSSKHIEKAIELANSQLKGSKEYPTIARLYMIYGDHYLEKNDLSKALEKYHQGLQYFDSILDDNVTNNPNISLVPEGIQPLQLLNKKAETLMDLYEETKDQSYLDNSISTYTSALSLITKMKSDFINEGSKYRVNEIASSIFPKALEATYTKYQIDEDEESLGVLFDIIERNKAEILFQNISSKYNLIASALPAELIKNGIDLRYNISYYSKLLSEEELKEKTDEAEILKYKDKLFRLNEELAFHDQEIKENYPDFYAFKSDFGQQVSIQDLKNILTNNQIILEYFQTQENMYVLSIRQSQVEIMRTPLVELAKHVSQFHQSISKPPGSNSIDIQELRSTSQQLANLLFPKSINFTSEIREIIIITDGILNKIPFEPIQINSNGKMLIEHCNIAYNYSANQFFENHHNSILKDPKILSLTPTFKGYSSQERDCNSATLGDLPFAKEEFNFIRSHFKGKFFIDSEANIDNLKSNMAEHSIIHLATHACVNDQNPMLSKIYFSDGALTNYDIQNLNSRPELVMLSACNTASGEVREGEGVIGLSRGFFEAGVKGVQSSLWSINDKSSSEIVVNVYKNLKQGKSKSEALRAAKLSYLEGADKLRSHPYYWAALIHIGNDNPIQFSNGFGPLKVIGLLAIVSIFLFLYFFIKRR